jgi:multiple sugar transport system substrate-binding protein
MRTRWMVAAIAAAVVFGMTFAGCAKAAPNGPVELNALFMKQAGYSEDDITAMTAEYMKANPKIKVNLTFVAYEELEPKILAAYSSGGYDVVLGDCIWPPKFSKAGVVLDVTKRMAAVDTKDVFKGALDSVGYDGKYYGMPWLNDCKYLFYNKSMLKKAGFSAPPATWDELASMAKAIKAKGIVKYPIAWSWSQAEALICDYTALSEAFGGGMIGPDGKPAITAPGNQKALEFMVATLKNGLTNPKSTEMLENDVLATFVAGNAAFGLNWTYMYAAGKDPAQSKIGDDVGIAVIPGTEAAKSATVNGGMPLMITSGSKNPDAAWKYILYISSKDVQKKYAKNALPIWKSLFDDAAVVATSPEVVGVSKTQYDYIRNRPQVPYYGELSTELQADVQSALLGKKSPKEALEAAQAKALELAAKK